VWPLPSQYRTLSSPFCERRSWESCHPGIDIPAPVGTPIVAADAGTVILAGPSGGYGNYTCIQHTKSLSTCYAHQSRQMVRPGDDVKRGQVIGLVGCTGLCFGSHLHFETRNNGQVFDPMTFF
jgi:murein DD-endopeptidase MepM/ murein hydrolase activator NlpD